MSKLPDLDHYLIFSASNGGKSIKPTVEWRKNPELLMSRSSGQSVLEASNQNGAPAFLGFAMPDQGYFFIDIDDCRNPESGDLSAFAAATKERFGGCYQEVSRSGTGIHIVGRTWETPEHRCKIKSPKCELYTSKRAICLAQIDATGDAEHEATEAFLGFLDEYFRPLPPMARGHAQSGLPQPKQVVIKRIRAESAVPGEAASGAELWAADEEALARAFPAQKGDDGFDRSSADFALARKVVYYGAADVDAAVEIMVQSGLNRLERGGAEPDKWDLSTKRGQDYLYRTAENAFTAEPRRFHRDPKEDLRALQALRDSDRGVRKAIPTHSLIDGDFAAVLRFFPGPQAGVPDWERAWEETVKRLGKALEWDFFRVLEVCESVKLPKDGIDLESVVKVVFEQNAAPKTPENKGPFQNCVLVAKNAQMVLPSGLALDLREVDVYFSGKGPFLMGEGDDGPIFTRSAKTAVLQASPGFGVPEKVADVTYTAKRGFREIFEDTDGERRINLLPARDRQSRPGGTELFHLHLEKVLPDQRDREIIYYFIAALTQNPGKKALWAPIIQGGRGNGKSTIANIAAYCVGDNLTAHVSAEDIFGSFNDSLLQKTFVVCHELWAPEQYTGMSKVKSFLTESQISINRKGKTAVSIPNEINFFFCTNHKNPLRTREPRRFALFLSPQQRFEDLHLFGMGPEYFQKLHTWLREGGLAAIAHEMERVTIPEDRDPFRGLVAAPDTSSHEEVVTHSLGAVESILLDAVESGIPGFRDGWMSSVSARELLRARGRPVASPARLREIITSLGYVRPPVLLRGRASRVIPSECGERPVLYRVSLDGIDGLSGPETTQSYVDAQGY